MIAQPVAVLRLNQTLKRLFYLVYPLSLFALFALFAFSDSAVSDAAPPPLTPIQVVNMNLSVPQGWVPQVSQNQGVATIAVQPPQQTPTSPSIVLLGVPSQLGPQAAQALRDRLIQSTMPDASPISHRPSPSVPPPLQYGAYRGTVSGVRAQIAWILVHLPAQQVTFVGLFAAPSATFQDWGGAGFLARVIGVNSTTPSRGGAFKIPRRYQGYNQPVVAYLAETVLRQSPAQIRLALDQLNQSERLVLSTYSAFTNQVAWFACQADPNLILRLSNKTLNCQMVTQSWMSTRSLTPQLTPQNCQQCQRQALDISMTYRGTMGLISKAEFNAYLSFRQNENASNSRTMQRILTNMGSSVCVCGDPNCDC